MYLVLIYIIINYYCSVGIRYKKSYIDKINELYFILIQNKEKSICIFTISINYQNLYFSILFYNWKFLLVTKAIFFFNYKLYKVIILTTHIIFYANIHLWDFKWTKKSGSIILINNVEFYIIKYLFNFFSVSKFLIRSIRVDIFE